MGDIADQIVNGECCEFCQSPPDGEPMGFPFTCDDCRDESPVKELAAVNKSKENCSKCNRRIKKVGFHNHIKDCHPELLDKACEALSKVLEDSK